MRRIVVALLVPVVDDLDPVLDVAVVANFQQHVVVAVAGMKVFLDTFVMR